MNLFVEQEERCRGIENGLVGPAGGGERGTHGERSTDI